MFDADLNFLLINKKTEIILNKEKIDILGKNFKELFPAVLENDYYKNLCAAAKGYTRSVRESIRSLLQHFIHTSLGKWHTIWHFGYVQKYNVASSQEKEMADFQLQFSSQNQEISRLSCS